MHLRQYYVVCFRAGSLPGKVLSSRSARALLSRYCHDLSRSRIEALQIGDPRPLMCFQSPETFPLYHRLSGILKYREVGGNELRKTIKESSIYPWMDPKTSVST